jgi:hypothetical protein
MTARSLFNLIEMKNITIVLQRTELNYLIKYDTLRISSDRIINLSYNEFKQLSEKYKISLLQNSMPIYEQEHEVVLIEYDSMLVLYDNAPTLEFKGILSIIPLTETGAQLLSSKLNTDFNILRPLDAKIYKAFTNNRNHILRLAASCKLCILYNVSMPSDAFIADFQKATLFQLNNEAPKRYDSTLAHLIDFNTTPSFIPEGNTEALIKSACVGIKKLGKEVEQVPRSKFYSFVIDHKDSINSMSLFQAILYIEDKIKLFDETEKRFNQLKETLSEEGKYDNAFLSFSYFYFLKKMIEKNDYDISAPKDAILELKHYDLKVTSRVLFMLGYTFSIQTISKSIQSFSKCELLKTQKNLDLEWTPKEVEQEIIEIPNQEKVEFKPEDIVIQVNNFSEDEKAIEIELSVEKQIDKKNLPDNENIDKVEEPIINNITNIEISKDENKAATVAEEPSVPLVDPESISIDTNKTDLILNFDDYDSINSNETIINDEVTKTVSELSNWIGSQKTLKPEVRSKWNKFIENLFHYGNYTLTDISNKVEKEKIKTKLTPTMLIKLKEFYNQ